MKYIGNEHCLFRFKGVITNHSILCVKTLLKKIATHFLVVAFLWCLKLTKKLGQGEGYLGVGKNETIMKRELE